MDIWQSLRLIRTRSLLFFAASVIAFVSIMVAPSFAGKKILVYRSAAKVLITPNTGPVPVTGSAQQTSPVKTWFADEATLLTLLSSQDLLDVVIDSASLKLDWTELRERIKLQILSSANNQVSLIEISVLGYKPEESRLLAITLCEKFIQYVQQLSAAEHDKTVAFLERERRNTEREMALAQKRLLKIGILPRGAGQTDPFEEAWVQLQSRRSELERDAALSEAELEEVDVAAREGLDFNSEGTNAGVLNSSVSEERLKLAQLQEVYTDRSPQVKAQKERLRRMEQVQSTATQATLRVRQEAARRKHEKILALLRETEQRLRQMESKRPSPEKNLEYANQERQLAMWQENYLGLTRQLYAARVIQQSSRREGAFTIVEKPQPGRLVSGKVGDGSMLSRALLGIPVSLVCGLGVVIGLEYFNASMQMQARIEAAMGLPIIGLIPSLPDELVTGWDAMKGAVGRGKPPATKSG